MPSEKRLRVMVVDDQQTVCDVVADTVRFAGHEVVGTARDGVEAVTQAELLRPDLVVMDVWMPRMNGVEAMHAMLRSGTVGRVLLMSGGFELADLSADEIFRSGAAAFLEKPFDVKKFMDLLDQWSRG